MKLLVSLLVLAGGGTVLVVLCFVSWNLEVELMVWPELSPVKTRLAVLGLVVVLEMLVVLDVPTAVVGKVTLEVWIVGEGSTSTDSFLEAT